MEHVDRRDTQKIVTKKMSRYKAKLSRRNKKVLQQNPSSKRNDIIQIVNTNFNLIMDEQGQRQPIGLFKYRCIIAYDNLPAEITITLNLF